MSSAGSALRAMLGLVAWTVGIYSLMGHKEWRFIHPVLPLLHIIASQSLVDGHHATKKPAREKDTSSFWRHLRLPVRARYIAHLSLTLPAIVYISTFHSRAQIEVIHYLRSLPPDEVNSVGFLMPCHSTPWQAYLHRPELSSGRLWALGCEPPLEWVVHLVFDITTDSHHDSNSGQDIATYKDQTDIFYDDPVAYLQTHFPPEVAKNFPASSYPSSKPGEVHSVHRSWQHEWPEYIVCFGALLEVPDLRSLLERKGYKQVWRESYGWEEDGKRRGGVMIWKFQGAIVP